MFFWTYYENAQNIREHGVSLQIAEQVFNDPLRRTNKTRIKVGEGDLWESIGMVGHNSILIVSYVYIDSVKGSNNFKSNHIHIFSARHANSAERCAFENLNGSEPTQVLGHANSGYPGWFGPNGYRERLYARKKYTRKK
ncbi:BrnT family toxin [Xenorhabdus sp. ZM]|uniref:BrnT family toxin n=1 Tax=Xenorhabdus szentirmaii TaxID=290112 RepID=UPI0019AB6C9E|nr:BrnT family toxin [Xenorhabdus sp. ZM]MBD2807062.1 BrnT family toxin [Xenorhabdus sp. ZM]